MFFFPFCFTTKLCVTGLAMREPIMLSSFSENDLSIVYTSKRDTLFIFLAKGNSDKLFFRLSALVSKTVVATSIRAVICILIKHDYLAKDNTNLLEITV